MPQRTTHPHLPLQSALTFGVELEFLLAAIPLDYPSDMLPKYRKLKKRENPFPDDPRQVSGIFDYPHPRFTPDKTSLTYISERRDHEYAGYATCIADSLKGAGVPASPFYHFPPHVNDAKADASGVRQTWEVKRDPSVYVRWQESAPESFFQWQSVELASPVFYSVAEAFEEVHKVCQHLTTRYRVLTNSTCGLHIHVGNCSAGYDLRVLKQLMASLWTWQPQIEVLHPWARSSAKGDQPFALPLRYRSSKLAHRPDIEGADEKELSNWKALAMVYKCGSKDDLIYWLSNPAGYNAYKMENLLQVVRKNVRTGAEATEQLVGSKRTIEFRQHEGTLDSERIVSWARLAIGFIDKARWRDPDFALGKVLEHLEIEDKHPEDAWGRALEEMLNDVGGKEVEGFYMSWLGKEREWLQVQLEKRKAEEDEKVQPQVQRSDVEKEQMLRTALAELKLLDKQLATLEAHCLEDMDVKLAKLDNTIVEAEEERRGRSKEPKMCTATTDLSRGSAMAKMTLLSRAAGGRIPGFKRL